VAYRVVVLGTSWGGLQALRCIGGALPADFPLPVVAVQHRHRDSDHLLQQLVQDRTAIRVSDVEDKEPMLPGHLYIAPPDYHLLIEGRHFALSLEAPVLFSRPSVDVLFESAAYAYGASLTGVVLSGANEDGAAGARTIRQHGGHVYVQEPKEALARTMPEAAIRLADPQFVGSLAAIAERLCDSTGWSP